MPSSNYYTGLQKPIGASMIDRIELPKTIPCTICLKFKAADNFSNKQLSDLKTKISRFGRAYITPKNSIRCFQCTGFQQTEMYCILCQKVKPLKGFALAQRRNPDQAKCLLCMEAQSLVLPADLAEYTRDEHGEDGVRAPHNPWERDIYSGQYLLEKENKDKPQGLRSIATGSSRELSGFESSGQSISGYSGMPPTFRSKAYQESVASENSSTVDGHGGVRLTTGVAAAGNTRQKLTYSNLSNLKVDPSESMNRLSIEDAYGASSDESDGDFNPPPRSVASAIHAPQGSVSGFSSVTQRIAEESSEEEKDDVARPQRLPPKRAQDKYTAYDQHGNRHQIADTVSVVSSQYAPSSAAAASTGGWTTVSKAQKISHSGFDLRESTEPKNPRKFARVRPQNLAADRIGESLIHRPKDEEKKPHRPTNRHVQYDSGDDEDY